MTAKIDRDSSASRLANGHLFGIGVDTRSVTARRFRDLHTALSDRLGGAPLSPAQEILIRRSATLSLLAEAMESKLVSGKSIDADEYLRLVGAQQRVLTSLGFAASDNKPAIPEQLRDAPRLAPEAVDPPSFRRGGYEVKLDEDVAARTAMERSPT